MIIALGRVEMILLRHFFLYNTIGARIREAPINLSNVRDSELATSASLSDDKKAPATSSVAIKINVCALISVMFNVKLEMLNVN